MERRKTCKHAFGSAWLAPYTSLNGGIAPAGPMRDPAGVPQG